MPVVFLAISENSITLDNDLPAGKENSIKGFFDVTKTWFKGKVDVSADPQAAGNNDTSSLAAS